MSIDSIILVVILLLLIAAMPIWPYSRTWGRIPSLVITILLILVVILII